MIMIKKLCYSITILTLLSSCAKDSGTPDPEFSKDIQEKLKAYVWHPVAEKGKDVNNHSDYNPDNCELDNNYRFLFHEKSNQLDLDKGAQVCGANKGTFEWSTFEDKNNTSFTFNKEKGTIKFANQDQYSSYTVVVNSNQLVLTSQNNNPAAFVAPVRYYFKGVKAP